jgi:hypothetical protein
MIGLEYLARGGEIVTRRPHRNLYNK